MMVLREILLIIACILLSIVTNTTSFYFHTKYDAVTSSKSFLGVDSGASSGSSSSLTYRRAILPSRLFASPLGPNELDEQTKARIEEVINKNKVVLFMKGNKLFPQCGFSNTAVRILDALGTSFETVNVLEDEKIRNGIKIYSSWPTIPQLYINKEFVGGSDIMVQMYQNGELAEMLELANAS